RGQAVSGYPALVDEGDSVAIRVLPSETEGERATWAGTRRLLMLTFPSPMRECRRQLADDTKLALARSPHGSFTELLEDCTACAVDHLMFEHGGPARDEQGFEALRGAVQAELVDTVVYLLTVVGGVLAAGGAIQERLGRAVAPSLRPAFDDVRAQLSRLVHPGFVTVTGARRLPDLLRYLRAIERRLEKLAEGSGRDQERMSRVHRLEDRWRSLVRSVSPAGTSAQGVEDLRWMIEELRVSVFAQALGTAHPVSEQRIVKELDRLAQNG
ncbi:MAG: DUF3418 domain-containing protein, partial [Acidimicrobiia bacterium]